MGVIAYNALDDQAKAILRQNDRGAYTVPTRGLYPYQWNWDSAFAAWGFSTFDLDRAWTELETLLSGQWGDGRVPHIIFHEKSDTYFPGADEWQGKGPLPSSGITQEPIAAISARRLYEADPAASEARMRALFPKLKAWHRWFIDNRLDQGAVCITHPWESRDNAPDWDETMRRIDPGDLQPYVRRDLDHVDAAMRPSTADYDRYIYLLRLGRDLGWDEARIRQQSPFRVAEPMLTFTLLRANRDLAALACALGEDTTELEDWTRRLEDGCRTLWNEERGHYDSRDVTHRIWSNSLSCASFLCWFAGIGNDRMEQHLRRVVQHVAYAVPSLDPQDPRFEPARYWRGPVWAVVNCMIGRGLAEAGLHDLAERVKRATETLIARHGFPESFSPVDGSPSGGKSFTWTAAIWLAWIRDAAKTGGDVHSAGPGSAPRRDLAERDP